MSVHVALTTRYDGRSFIIEKVAAAFALCAESHRAMPVFDAATQVGRFVSDPGTDKRLPPGGSLSYGSITSPSALAGTLGIDVALVHGDQWDQVEGNRTCNILMNHICTVFQDEVYKVLIDRRTTIAGNYYKTVIGNYNQTIIGIHNVTNISNRNNTYVSPKIEVHTAPKQSQEPTGWWQYIKENTKIYYYQTNIVLGAAFNFSVFEVNIALIRLGAFGFDGTATGFQMEFICFRIDVKLSDNRITAMALKVSALNGHLGPLDMQAVGLKLMGLALGVNQFI
jgi:hypothetical protein